MKKILSNPAAFFMLIVLIVTICVVSLPFIIRSAKEANAKSIVDGHVCCVCGAEAEANVGLSKFYCDECFDKEYGDIPIYRGPFHSN